MCYGGVHDEIEGGLRERRRRHNRLWMFDGRNLVDLPLFIWGFVAWGKPPDRRGCFAGISVVLVWLMLMVVYSRIVFDFHDDCIHGQWVMIAYRLCGCRTRLLFFRSLTGAVEGSVVDPHQTKARAKRARGGLGGWPPRKSAISYPRKEADGRGR
jgi:hypothetical protein